MEEETATFRLLLEQRLDRLRAAGREERVCLSREHHARLRRASVMVLISADGRILLTQRSRNLRSHPGEVCLPGGKEDPEDGGDPWETARRETLEEAGLELVFDVVSGGGIGGRGKKDSSSVLLPLKRLCVLPTVESLGHLCVTPVVGFLPHHSSTEIASLWKLNPSEVAMAFWAPLAYFHEQEANSNPTPIEWQGDTFVFRTYEYPLPGGATTIPITGLTAHIVHQVSEWALVVRPSTTTPDHSRNNDNHHDRASSELVDSQLPKRPKHNDASDAGGPLQNWIDASVSTPSAPAIGGGGGVLLEGTLHRWIPSGSTASSSKGHWGERYLVLVPSGKGGILHQYDHAQQARRKSRTASKKNRLVLDWSNDNNDDDDDVHLILPTNDGEAPLPPGQNARFVFGVSVLGGRIVWFLAASTEDTRDRWVRALRGGDPSSGPETTASGAPSS